ncbi:MAG: S1-like domain-containing RNA-binding protein [Verrucomicrobia bacterium]|nr:S1-like domain-containing RNA-binding protein [Verrucomicrobiota bacterium]
MALIGKRNRLPFIRQATPGYYLNGGSHGEILLPGRYLPQRPSVGELVDVFVYRDSEDRLVATTEAPYATVGEFAFLRVVSVNPRIGVFLDWGLEKDLLLPIREQTQPLREGDWLVVHVALDQKTDRIIASGRLNRYLNLTPADYVAGQAVKMLVIGESPLGYNVAVNHAHRGLLYHGDLPGPLTIGQPLDGFVRLVRPDGKLDLALDAVRVGYQRIVPVTEKILEGLKASEGGRLSLHDNSPPEEIRAAFGVSKKAFKQAIGVLFKSKQIVIEKSGIRLAGK